MPHAPYAPAQRPMATAHDSPTQRARFIDAPGHRQRARAHRRRPCGCAARAYPRSAAAALYPLALLPLIPRGRDPAACGLGYIYLGEISASRAPGAHARAQGSVGWRAWLVDGRGVVGDAAPVGACNCLE